MYLIVGLGNPGEAYAGTRHNIGFQALDHLAVEHKLSFAVSQWQAQIVRCNLWGEALILVKPETFMNESGRAVSQIASAHGVLPSQIVVLHDDLDLELGRIKVAANRGAGGHNGIVSLTTHLHSREFVRIRIGIGRPPEPSVPIINYVLARFQPAEQEVLCRQMDPVHQIIRTLVEKGPMAAMSAWNSRTVV